MYQHSSETNRNTYLASSNQSYHLEPHPPRRLEGFHVPPTPVPSHQSPTLSISPQMLHQPFNSHFTGFGSQGSGLFTDAELLESLARPPTGSFTSSDEPIPLTLDQHHPASFRGPLRNLPRHLDPPGSSPALSNAPSSPKDFYSPGSSSTTDFFGEADYGSFSSIQHPPPSHEEAGHKERIGRASSMSGRARSRSARRTSGSFPTPHAPAPRTPSLLSRTPALAIPAAVTAQASSERQQAISVPTYLSSLNLGNGPSWLSPPTLPYDQTRPQSIGEPSFALSSPAQPHHPQGGFAGSYGALSDSFLATHHPSLGGSVKAEERLGTASEAHQSSGDQAGAEQE